MKNIGLRIKIKRKLSGLTQEALGRSVGVSKVAVSRWEADKNAINPELLEHISKVGGKIIQKYYDIENAKKNQSTENSFQRYFGIH